jgi:putative aminophosphonate oxidoreductase
VREGLISWWLAEAAPLTEPEPLDGDVAADICVVGGGYTGLWTALRLKELDPSLTIVLVEADVCGGGASGRNGGFAMTLWHHFIALRNACGTDEAFRLAHLSDDAVREIGSFCAEQRIDAGYRQDGWYWTATNPFQLGAWDETIRVISQRGHEPFVRVKPEILARSTGSPVHIGGVFEQVSATLQPALLARGLLRVARERGVQVFERSPMVKLDRSTPLVHTPRGRVRAERLVLAMNAWALGLRELRRAFVIVSSDIVITERVPSLLEHIGWQTGASISNSRLMVNYYRTTSDGRIAFGKGGGRLAYGSRMRSRFTGPSPIAGEVAAELRATYPTVQDTTIAASWTGPIDRTLDGLPFFTRVGPNIVCAAGYSGNGVGPSVLGGRILASLALGLDDGWASCGLVRKPPSFPPEPFRYIGGRVVRRAVARKEGAQNAGRRPARLDVALSRLGPPGLVPVD